MRQHQDCKSLHQGWKWTGLVGFLALAHCCAPTSDCFAQSKQPVDVKMPAAKVDAHAKADPGPVWLSSRRQARTAALRAGKPILIRAGAEWCGWCKKLSTELADPNVLKELENWTLCYIDIDQSPAEAKALAIGGVPALRLLTADGNVVESRDGYLKASELLDWLTKNREAASVKPLDELFEDGDPQGIALVRLVRELGQRDPMLREAAVSRLAGSPQTTAPSVVRVLAEGTLQAKLAAVDLLREWKAPGVDEFDPWRPETITPTKIQKLKEWAPKVQKPTEAARQPLDANEIAAANKDIDRLLAAKEEAIPAIREQIAKLGKQLLPTVNERLKKVDSDGDRQRLTALRYRLAASTSLVVKWRDGLDRLSATSIDTRHQAADELIRLATAAEEDLLLELFSDPDPLVREISLRGLFDISGGAVTGVLSRLLGDPDANVRAAILKILTENPAPSLTSTLADYVKKEKDPDLVVHAARALRETGSDASTKVLIDLLKHESWRVRAEAAEGLAKKVDRHSMYGGGNESKSADIYVAMIDVLDDADGFVVGQAVKALKDAPLESAVEPLVNAAKKHPEMTGEIVSVLAGNSNMRAKAISHLRKFCKSATPNVRAAAIRGLMEAANEPPIEQVRLALQDPESSVRIAAATTIRSSMEKLRPHSGERLPFGSLPGEAEEAAPQKVAASAGKESHGFFDALGSLFQRQGKNTPSQAPPVEDSPIGIKVTSENGKLVMQEIPLKPTESPDGKRTKSQTAPSKKEDAKKNQDSSSTKTPPTPAKEAPTTKNPAIEPEAVAESNEDAWIAKLAKGKVVPEWMTQQKDLLEKMLLASSNEEKLQAALTLLSIGESSKPLQTIYTVISADPKLTALAAEGLIWQTWKGRLELHRRLLAVNPPAESQDEIFKYMLQLPEDRALEPVWNQVAKFVDRPEVAAYASYRMMESYFGARYYDSARLPAKAKKRILKNLQPHFDSGSDWQRLIALALVYTADKEAAAELAEKILANPRESSELRGDAFQIALIATESESQAKKRAVEALAGNAKELYEPALIRLAMGNNGRNMLRDSIYLYGSSTYTPASSSSQRTLPDPPKGLKVETLRSIIDGGNPKSAALAGYLLVLFEDRSGFDPLLRYWRKQAPNDPDYQKLVVDSIARLDDDNMTPILEGIFNRYDKARSSFDISNFYWTIRTMEGPRVKALRSRIRKEVGMENLR